MPRSIELLSKNGINISFDECEKINQKSPATVSPYVKESKTISSEFSRLPVEITYTNQDFAEIAPIEMRYGNFFQQSFVSELNRVIVISEDLAFELFHTYDAVGMTVEIDNNEYMICGLYQKDTDILSQLSSNGKNVVYLPYSNLKSELPIKNLYIKTDATFFLNAKIDILQDSLNKTISFDVVNDYSNIQILAKQTVKLYLFIVGISIIILLIIVSIKLTKSFFSQKKRFTWFLIPLGIVLICIGLFMLVRFDFFIPTNMLPYDNIFDVKNYFDKIITQLQQNNSLEQYNFYWNYGVSLLKISVLTCIISVIFFFIAFFNVVRAIKKRMEMNLTWKV